MVMAAPAEGVEVVEVAPRFEVEFSEALDPDSVHRGSVAIVAWTAEQPCTEHDACDAGPCVAGRCWSPPALDDFEDLDQGDFVGGEAIVLELDGARLEIAAARPLADHAVFSLAIGAVRDPSGAAQVDAGGQPIVWARPFVTGAAGSSGPEPILLTPRPGQSDVPTNVARIQVELSPPVPWPQPEATLFLEPDDGRAWVELGGGRACPGFEPGRCLEFPPADGVIRPHVRYRPAGGTFVDHDGRTARLPAVERETWFATAAGPDARAPAIEAVAELRGPCLAVWLSSPEPVEGMLRVDDGAHQDRVAAGVSVWGVPLEPRATDAPPLAWSLEVEDLAGNPAEVSGVLAHDGALDPARPRVAITEVLANPLGDEPRAEFIELRADPEATAPVVLVGAVIADEGGLDGDALPEVSLLPGEIALLVAEDYAPGDGDVPPAPGTKLIHVDASLGNGGLKNVGEAITLWVPGPGGEVNVLARYGNWIDTSATAHGGRSVIADPSDGCDLPDRWRSHPDGRASPGALP